MTVLIFAMLGGIMGWGLSRGTQSIIGPVSVIVVNILTGMLGALAAGWFLTPLLAGSAKGDFTLAVLLVMLGSVALLTVVTLLREAAVQWDAHT